MSPAGVAQLFSAKLLQAKNNKMLSKLTLFTYARPVRAGNALSLMLAIFMLTGCGADGQTGTIGADDQPPVTTQQPEETAESGETTDNPNQTPTSPASTTPFAEDITDLILVTGQSNALGADTDFDAELDSPNDRVFAFTNEGWQKADLHQIWDLNWHPRGDPDTDPSNNFGFHFAKKVAERRSHRVVGFILVTAPGEAIATWDYESDFYLSIRNRVIDALNQLPNKATIDGILWHQGETDWIDNVYYENKFADVINNFRSESWFSSDKPFICGETATAPLNRILRNLNSDGDQWTGCVEANGLRTHEDQVHFLADGLRVLGTRYATKYLQMIEQ